MSSRPREAIEAIEATQRPSSLGKGQENPTRAIETARMPSSPLKAIKARKGHQGRSNNI